MFASFLAAASMLVPGNGDNHSVRLQSGATLTFVGVNVGNHRRTWSPTGRPLPKWYVPRELSGKGDALGRNVVTLVFEVEEDGTDEPSVQFKMSDGSVPYGPTYTSWENSPPWGKPRPKRSKWLLAESLLRTSARRVSARVGIGTGNWNTVSTYDPRGRLSSGLALPGFRITDQRAAGPQSHAGMRIQVKLPSAVRAAAYRVVTVSTGGEFMPSGLAVNSRIGQSTFYFVGKYENLKSVKVQTRPLRWFKFGAKIPNVH